MFRDTLKFTILRLLVGGLVVLMAGFGAGRSSLSRSGVALTAQGLPLSGLGCGRTCGFSVEGKKRFRGRNVLHGAVNDRSSYKI